MQKTPPFPFSLSPGINIPFPQHERLYRSSMLLNAKSPNQTEQLNWKALNILFEKDYFVFYIF